MTSSSDDAARRARWRSYFEQTLIGNNREVDAATDAAMEAVAGGEGQQAIIQAGRAAAKRVRSGGTAQTASGTASDTADRSRTPPRQSAPTPPSQPRSRQENTRSPGGPQPSAMRTYPPNSGVVSLMEKRTESLDGQFFQVWSFRLMRLENGSPVGAAIPVEIRGRSIIGQLTQGDVVEIPGGAPGETRIVKALRNLTTESTIEAKGRPFRRARTLRRTWRMFVAVVKTLLALVAVAALVVIALFVLNEAGVISWPEGW